MFMQNQKREILRNQLRLVRQKTCRECGGSALCKHGKLKAQCRECGGSAFYKHGARKAQKIIHTNKGERSETKKCAVEDVLQTVPTAELPYAAAALDLDSGLGSGNSLQDQDYDILVGEQLQEPGMFVP